MKLIAAKLKQDQMSMLIDHEAFVVVSGALLKKSSLVCLLFISFAAATVESRSHFVSINETIIQFLDENAEVLFTYLQPFQVC